METPTKLLCEFHDEMVDFLESKEEIAVSFTDYFKKSIDLMEAYEKHIAMDAYLEGVDVGRKMMKAWMQNKEIELEAFEEFQKYWKSKTIEQ